MSLTVPPALLHAAETGPVDEEAFVACVRDSLPYAWETVSRVAADLAATDAEFADNVVPPPGDAERGHVRGARASHGSRAGGVRHWGNPVAFQNCPRGAAFRPGAAGSEAYRRFTSSRGQLLNQSPALRNC